MIIYLIGLVLLIIGCVIERLVDGPYKFINAIKVAVIVLLVGVIVNIVAMCVSYGTYVKSRSAYDSIIAQHRGAIELYNDKAVLNLSKTSMASMTDFKYEGYQNNMADFISSLRNSVIRYNETIITKRILHKNIFFKWIIVLPDQDMLPINIIDG